MKLSSTWEKIANSLHKFVGLQAAAASEPSIFTIHM